jgi:acetyl-CoA decarbonylase/synthase complex subunit gamma
VGEEEVMFRHEKAFLHEPGMAVLISDKMSESAIDEKLQQIKAMGFERIGRILRPNILALYAESDDAARFEALVQKTCAATPLPLILICDDTDALLAAAGLCADKRPLVYPITQDNVSEAIPRLKELGVPVGVKGDGLEGVISVTSQLKDGGIEEVVLDPGSRNLLEGIRDQTLIRRSALKKGFRPLGFPTIAFPCFMYPDKAHQAIAAAALMTKYGDIVVLSHLDEAFMLPLLVHRFNIFSDPRRPMTVEEKIYEIGRPDDQAPVLISTNYALDFFIVSGAIEEGNIPAYLCIKDTGGIGVLAAWTSGKFTGEAIADFLNKYSISEKVSHRKLIIPGVAKKLKEEMEEELPEWEIVLGPMEASDIPAFLKEEWSR